MPLHSIVVAKRVSGKNLREASTALTVALWNVNRRRENCPNSHLAVLWHWPTLALDDEAAFTFSDTAGVVYANAPLCPDWKGNDSSYGSEDETFPPGLPAVVAWPTHSACAGMLYIADTVFLSREPRCCTSCAEQPGELPSQCRCRQ